MPGKSDAGVRLTWEGAVAVISYDRAEKHNAFNDAMDRRFFEILAELHALHARERGALRAVLWRGEGKSFSSGRDTAELGQRNEDLSDLEFIERGHRGTQLLLEMPVPVIAALKGWVIGGSFERALLCDLRIAAEDARMRLPELAHGVLTDSGGAARLFQIAGHGLAADLCLTGRLMGAAEALQHGVVSRVVAADELEAQALLMAQQIAKAPPLAVRLFLRGLRRLANPPVVQALAEEALAQSLVFASADYQETKTARAESRPPQYQGC